MNDREHVHISHSMASCGVLELSQVGSDHRKVVYAIASYLYHPARGTPAAFLLWSDIVDGNGDKLVRSLVELGLAIQGVDHIVSTETVENPKTSNNIRVHIWTIQHEKLRQWYKDEAVRRIQAR